MVRVVDDDEGALHRDLRCTALHDGLWLLGGSYQQHQAADAYPGLLDGIIPGCSFPEFGFATIHSITDARLLVHYFDDTAPGSFTQEQQRRVAGFLKYETMRTNTVYVGALRIAAPPLSPYCAIVPLEQRYDPKTNPGGARCNVYDHTINVYGRDPATSFALRPLDNVGIQYAPVFFRHCSWTRRPQWALPANFPRPAAAPGWRSAEPQHGSGARARETG